MTEEEKLVRHNDNRNKILAAIIREVFGPEDRFADSEALLGEPTPFDLSQEVSFADWSAYGKVRPVVKGTGEEILKREPPTSRYGMGILFPDSAGAAKEATEEQDAAQEAGGDSSHEDPSERSGEEDKAAEKRERMELARQKRLERRAARIARAADTTSAEDDETDAATESADLRLANLRKQRSMGVSLVVDGKRPGRLAVAVRGGRYFRFNKVKIGGKIAEHETWWARTPVSSTVDFALSEILSGAGTSLRRGLEVPSVNGLPPLDLTVEIVVRGRERMPDDENYPDSARLLTVTLVNRGKCTKAESLNERCLFQAGFTVTCPDSDAAILPYPQSRLMNEGPEQQSLELLYRHEHTFATGHGCAGTWTSVEESGFAQCVKAEAIPAYETPSITPNLKYEDPATQKLRSLRIGLDMLADDSRSPEGTEQLRLMVSLYEKWISDRRTEAASLKTDHASAAERHLKDCDEALRRMKEGLALLERDTDSNVCLAFRLTNRAMLMQALTSRAKLRHQRVDPKTRRASYDSPHEEPGPATDGWKDRAWRPFQIAFFLMNLPALADPKNPDRGVVDLIWFPTGGGKTEAYLACAAFSILMRRLRDPDDVGTHVLMRYTLRLLTAQQFQRASSLICALEVIRETRQKLLGENPISIGIWVGGATTPNRCSGAVKALSKARRNGEEDYKMVLLKCPWCGAAMGPVAKGAKSQGYDVQGVKKRGEEVFLHCPDKSGCRFSKRLPVEVIDEEIYKSPPTYIIATVDKFAAMAWRSECRSLFGMDSDGQRAASPPGLIIQDELHLITGPLGSMVGLYETLIDELSTDRRNPDNPIKPKLIAATATTRASAKQIRDLYAREQSSIFPPPGLDAADSFFAKYERDDNGRRKPGRRYVGFLPLNYSSALTASVRLYAAALCSAFGFDQEEERDPWWTLLVFYNSLRELGANLTLFGSDIPERMKDIQRRWFPGKKMRFADEILELTGRLANSEVPRALEALERSYKVKPAKGQWPVDACLASNIIEVGVDVDRLGLMAVAGQPKTTAQYIQATGRVGRGLPGLILVNYSATKARDRSHYEHFQAYHARLYAQVEPSSVTPFTIPILDRAMHAILVAAARQTVPSDDLADPSKFSGTALEAAAQLAKRLMEERIDVLAREDKELRSRMHQDLDHCYRKRAKEWASWQPDVWHEYFPKKDSAEQPLIRPYGSACPIQWAGRTWEAPNSLRGVDAECTPSIPLPEEDEDE